MNETSMDAEHGTWITLSRTCWLSAEQALYTVVLNHIRSNYIRMSDINAYNDILIGCTIHLYGTCFLITVKKLLLRTLVH